MKKFLFLLVIFLTPMFVLADASGPTIIQYKAVVTNPNGVKTDDGTIPYNAEVTVENEYDTEAFVLYCEKGKDDCLSGNIKLSDIMPLEKEIIPTGKEKQDGESNIVSHKSTIVVLAKQGAKLRKGPASAFEEYDVVVPYNASVKVTYIVSSYAERHSTSPWYYVNDGKYKGWIDNTYSSNNHIIEKTDDLVVFKSTKLKDDNGNSLTTFSSETILKNVYYDENNYAFYMNQNGKWGKLEGYFAKVANYYGVTTKKTNIISSSEKVIETLPLGTSIKVLSNREAINDKVYSYVEYNNKKGFVLSDDFISVQNDVNNNQIKLINNSELHEYLYDPEDDYYYVGENVVANIPKDTLLTAYSKYDGGEIEWYLVAYNNKIGFIKTSNAKIIKNTTNPTPTETPTVTPEVTPGVDEVTTTPTPSDEPKSEPHYKNEKSDNLIIYCLIGALIVSLTSIVSILLINKRKMQKLVKEMEKKEIKSELKEEDKK